MSIESHLAAARRFAAERRYDLALAEYEYVLDIDPDNPEARSGVDKLRGATPLRGGDLSQRRGGGTIKTDFFAHQAEEISKPVTRQVPVMIVLAVVGIGILYGLFQGAMYMINFEKNLAMKNMEVKLEKPVQRDGAAYVNVRIINYNPAPVKDTTFKYTISGPTGSALSQGTVTIPTAVPPGDSRSFADVRLGPLEGQAGRMRAELVDVKYGKSLIAPKLAGRFVEASSMRDREAVDAFKELIKADPEFAPSYVGLGKALAANDELDMAVKAYEKALKIDPDDANAHYNLGVALFYKSDRDGAKREFEQAAKLSPDDPSIARGLKEMEGGAVPGQGQEQESAAPGGTAEAAAK